MSFRSTAYRYRTGYDGHARTPARAPFLMTTNMLHYYTISVGVDAAGTFERRKPERTRVFSLAPWAWQLQET